MKTQLPTVIIFLLVSGGESLQTYSLQSAHLKSPMTSPVGQRYHHGSVVLGAQSTKQSEDFGPWRHMSGSSKVAVSFLLGTSLLFSSPVVAVEDITLSSTVTPDGTLRNGEYLDPLRPDCRRTLQIDKDGTTLHFTGTYVGSKDDTVLRGCSKNEIKQYGLRTTRFDGEILTSGGVRLDVGHGIDEGVWEPANSVTDPKLKFKAVDGIRWNDGTKWIVKDVKKPLKTVIGEWIFLAYIGFSTLAGVKGVWDKIQEKRNTVV